MSAFAKGARVLHHDHDGRMGTVVEPGPEAGTSRVDWDAIYGETIERDVDLMADAPMPSPEYALAKALRYRRQRDRALTDLATLVGIESNAAIEREQFERKLEDARFEYEAQLSNVAKALQRTRDELDVAETRLRNIKTWASSLFVAHEGFIDAQAAVRELLAGRVDTPQVDTPTD